MAKSEVVEAARLDGAGHLRIFWSIVLPLSRWDEAFVASDALCAKDDEEPA